MLRNIFRLELSLTRIFHRNLINKQPSFHTKNSYTFTNSNKNPKLFHLKNCLFRSFSTLATSPDLQSSLASTTFDPLLYANHIGNTALPFSLFAAVLEKVSQSRGKDSKAVQKTILCNFFRLIIIYDKNLLSKAFSLSLGQLHPSYIDIDIGIGESTIYKSISKLTNQTQKHIKSLEFSLGDLGIALQSLLENSSITSNLSLEEVYNKLCSITTTHGTNSVSLKEQQLINLLSKSSPLEAKYIIRIIQKSLKIGASEATVIDSLGRSVEITPPNQEYPHKSFLDSPKKLNLQDFIAICPNYNRIIEELLKIKPNDNADNILLPCSLTPGEPIKLMTAHPAKGLNDLIDRFKDLKVTCEYKYDGMRGQIHILDDKSIQIYSRSQENITSWFPDVVSFLKSSQDFNRIRNCIIDSEIVAYNRTNNLIQPFSEIQQRKRKNVKSEEIKIQVCVFAFDLVLLNDKNLISTPLSTRRELLHSNFTQSQGCFQFVEYKNIESYEEVENFLQQSIDKGCEGLMVKTLDEKSSYEAGVRSLYWLKMKKDYLGTDNALGDSLDLVPIGGYFGIGKRAGMYGSFLLGVYDRKTEQYQTVCKTGTGFSDQMLETLHSKMKPLEIPQPLIYKSLLKPDVWFKPETVWEIQGADISVSPIYTSAWDLAVAGKGLSLRFPRFIRQRDDKKPQESTSPEEMIFMYSNQILSKNKNNDGK